MFFGKKILSQKKGLPKQNFAAKILQNKNFCLKKVLQKKLSPKKQILPKIFFLPKELMHLELTNLGLY